MVYRALTAKQLLAITRLLRDNNKSIKRLQRGKCSAIRPELAERALMHDAIDQRNLCAQVKLLDSRSDQTLPGRR